MTTPDHDPGQGGQGEPVFERLKLESRAPALLLPKDVFWPAKVRDRRLHDVIENMLPKVVEVLSEPIPPASREQVEGIFAELPFGSSVPWSRRQNGDGSYEFSSGPHSALGVDGVMRRYNGVRYAFAETGRLIRVSYFTEVGSGQEAELFHSEFLYDEQGYLTSNSIWEKSGTQVTEVITYSFDPDNSDHQIPNTLTHTVTSSGPDGTRIEGLPMTVDLQNYADWIYRNPYGYRNAVKSDLESNPAHPAEVSVHEERSQILFADPDELERTLIAFASDIRYQGKFSDRHVLLAQDGVDEATLDESRKRIAASLVAGRITNEARQLWTTIQAAGPNQSISYQNVFDFGRPTIGNLEGLAGSIMVTKGGLWLGVFSANNSNPAEQYLASISGKERQLQSITLELPVNATAQDGYFLIDMQAIASRLALPMDHEAVRGFINHYMTHRPLASSPNNGQSLLWKDDESGVEVSLLTERADYDTGEYVDQYFGHDETSIWGPTPRHLSRRYEELNWPKLRIAIRQTARLDQDSSTLTQSMYDTAQMFRTRLAA